MTIDEKLVIANRVLDELRENMVFGALNGVEFKLVVDDQLGTLMCATMEVANGAVIRENEFIGKEDEKGIEDIVKFRLGIAAHDIRLMADDLLESLKELLGTIEGIE